MPELLNVTGLTSEQKDDLIRALYRRLVDLDLETRGWKDTTQNNNCSRH
jgi:hypothetical protein